MRRSQIIHYHDYQSANKVNRRLFTSSKFSETGQTRDSLVYSPTPDLNLQQTNSQLYPLCQNPSGVSFGGDIEPDQIKLMLESIQMVNFLTLQTAQNQQYINTKEDYVGSMKIKREQQQMKLNAQNRFSILRKNAFQSKKLKIAEERKSRKDFLSSQINIMKEEILRMKTQYSEQKYRNSPFSKNSQKAKKYKQRRQYSQISVDYARKPQKQRVYIPLQMPTYPYHPYQHHGQPQFYQPTHIQPNILKSRHSKSVQQSCASVTERFTFQPDSRNASFNREDKRERFQTEGNSTDMESFKFKLEDAIRKGMRAQLPATQATPDRYSRNQNTSHRSSKLSGQTLKKSRQNSDRKKRMSRQQNRQESQSGDELFRNILEESSKGHKMESVMGFKITQSNTGDEPIIAKDFQPHRNININRSHVQIEDLESSALSSAKKGNNSSSLPQDNYLGPAKSSDKGQTRKMKEKYLRQSSVNINVSNDNENSNSNQDEANLSKYRTIDFFVDNDDTMRRIEAENYKSLEKHQQSGYSVKIPKIKSKIKKNIPNAYQNEISVESHHEETPRNIIRNSKDIIMIQKPDSDDDIMNDIKLDPVSQISRKNKPSNNSVSMSFKTYDDNKDDDDEFLGSIRLSTQSRISREKATSVKGSVSGIKQLKKSQKQHIRTTISDLRQVAPRQLEEIQDQDLFTVEEQNDLQDFEPMLRKSTASKIMKKSNIIRRTFQPKYNQRMADSIEQADEEEQAKSSINNKTAKKSTRS